MATKSEIINMWDRNALTVQDLVYSTKTVSNSESLGDQEFYDRVLIPRGEIYNYGEKILTLNKRELADWQEEHPNLMKRLIKQYQEYMTNLKAELDSKDIPDIGEDEI